MTNIIYKYQDNLLSLLLTNSKINYEDNNKSYSSASSVGLVNLELVNEY